MTKRQPPRQCDLRVGHGFEFRFTPAEWRHLLEDESFLLEADNSYRHPRRLMGVPVVIIPDHWTERP